MIVLSVSFRWSQLLICEDLLLFFFVIPDRLWPFWRSFFTIIWHFKDRTIHPFILKVICGLITKMFFSFFHVTALTLVTCWCILTLQKSTRFTKVAPRTCTLQGILLSVCCVHCVHASLAGNNNHETSDCWSKSHQKYLVRVRRRYGVGLLGDSCINEPPDQNLTDQDLPLTRTVSLFTPSSSLAPSGIATSYAHIHCMPKGGKLWHLCTPSQSRQEVKTIWKRDKREEGFTCWSKELWNHPRSLQVCFRMSASQFDGEHCELHWNQPLTRLPVSVNSGLKVLVGPHTHTHTHTHTPHRDRMWKTQPRSSNLFLNVQQFGTKKKKNKKLWCAFTRCPLVGRRVCHVLWRETGLRR